MSSLYIYYFKQYKNTWNNLSLRLRIEIIILFIIYFTFFTTRLINIFNIQLNNSAATPIGLTQIILHTLIILVSFSVPFIHLNLLPKQKGIVHFRSLPLNKLNTFWFLFFLHFKYQVIGLIIILPVFIALMVSTGFLLSINFIIFVLLYEIILIIFITNLSANSKQNRLIVLKYFLTIFFTFSIYFLIYFYTDYYFLFDPILFVGATILLLLRWKNFWFDWDNYIRKTNIDSTQQKRKNRWFAYSDFNKLPLPKISPLFAKEMLNYLRNRKFIRMQIFSIIIFCMILVFLQIKVHENFVLYSSAVTILFIWQHFSLQFNEKYMKADSAVFIKTLPFKYYQIWIAKFISEFLFVFCLLLFLPILYLLMGLPIVEIYQSLFVIILFSLVVLATIINFKIIFFDRPRFAGYAYHFFVIFVFVMSINYYLVGPIIALILLIYFTFYSYREFAR